MAEKDSPSAKALDWLANSKLDHTVFPAGPARTQLEEAGLLPSGQSDETIIEADSSPIHETDASE